MNFILRCLEGFFPPEPSHKGLHPSHGGFQQSKCIKCSASLQLCRAALPRPSPAPVRNRYNKPGDLPRQPATDLHFKKITCLFLKPAPNMDSNTFDWCAGLFSIECLGLGNMALIKNGHPTNCREFSHNCPSKTKQNNRAATVIAIHQNFCLVL